MSDQHAKHPPASQASSQASSQAPAHAPDRRSHYVRPGVRSSGPVGRDNVNPDQHRLQWNENPFDFPADLKEEVLQRLARLEWSRYPLGLRPWGLCERLARHTGLAPDEVVVSAGSSDVIKSVMSCVLHPGDAVVLPAPTFLTYRQNARMLQANVVETPLAAEDGFALPVDALVEACEVNDARLAVVCAPNNPTGTVYSLADVRRVAEGCPGLLLVDEAYAEFCDQDFRPLLELGNVVLLRTLSKLYAMAGVRVGYAMAPAGLAAEFQKGISSFPLSVFSEVAAEVALDHPERFFAVREQIVAERERMAAALGALPGVTVYPSGTNFLLVRVDSARQALLDYLLHTHNVLLSDLAAYPELSDCVRISVGRPEQNDLVIRGIAEHVGAAQ